jgi:hypothetical protein
MSFTGTPKESTTEGLGVSVIDRIIFVGVPFPPPATTRGDVCATAVVNVSARGWSPADQVIVDVTFFTVGDPAGTTMPGSAAAVSVTVVETP